MNETYYNEINCIKKAEVINTQNSRLPHYFTTFYHLCQRSGTLFSLKAQTVNILSSERCVIAVPATQLCCTRVKATSDANWTGVAVFQ